MIYTSPQREQRPWHLAESSNRKCRRCSARRKVANLIVNIKTKYRELTIYLVSSLEIISLVHKGYNWRKVRSKYFISIL